MPFLSSIQAIWVSSMKVSIIIAIYHKTTAYSGAIQLENTEHSYCIDWVEDDFKDKTCFTQYNVTVVATSTSNSHGYKVKTCGY